MLKTAPEPVDVQDLQFKLRCRLKVFDNVENSNFSRNCSLVTCASRFGLIFVGTTTSSIQAIQLKNIEEYNKSDGDKADYPRRVFPLPAPPLHVSVNCEHTVLSVVLEKNNCPCVLFYDVKSFYQQNVSQIGEVRLSPTPGVQVTEVNWNPALANIFTACKSDGTLGIYEVKNPGIDINELPAAAGATCFCWSPKGKQIAVGSRDGKITQYKPDLKAVKVINSPPLKEPYSLQSLQWVSNYQFIGIFQPVNPDSQVNFFVIDAPKTGEPTYTNYDDICYSNGTTRPPQFYLILLHNWNVLMAASSNSMEVGILGNTGNCWTQWIMGDAARAELPLSTNHQETLPVGCALDIGSTQPVPWGESTLPPAPLLLLFSHHGVLCIFNVVNVKEGIPSICAPPDPVRDTSGLSLFITTGIESKKDSQLKEMNRPLNLENPKVAPNIGNLTSTPLPLFKVQPNVPPVSQPVNLSQNSPLNLFGGQVTLTPVVQANKISAQSPHLMSIYPSLPTENKGAISTAPPLYPSLPTESKIATATVPPVSTVTHSVNLTTTPKPVATTAAPVVTIAPKLAQPEPSVDLTRTEVINVDLKAEEEAEKIFAQMVREECIYLESELKAVLHQGKNLKLNLGSDEDKTKIVESTKDLEDFFDEVVEISTTQNAEVHILKQNLLQSWAWYEEIKSRHLAAEDESRMMLIRAQPLDSASEKQLADIRHANYYLESQVSQAHIALDEQWENFQDYCKKTRKIQIPTMEMIFQTMVKQKAILSKQCYILKDIANRIKSKSRSALGASLITVDDSKYLLDELKRLRLEPEDVCQLQYEHVVNRKKNFTQEKSDRLKSFLTKKECRHISAIKPQLSSSIIQASPASKLKQFNLLTPEKRPIVKDAVSKKLDFVPSTPKPTVTSEIHSSTPIEGLQNFALKFEAKNFTNLPEKTFTPLTKSVISGSPNSAFVSTSFGSSTASTSTSTSLPFKPTFLGVSSAAGTTPIIKTTPSYVIATTSRETNQPVITISANSKPFSFANSTVSPDVTNVSKPSNLFSTATTKPAFSFSFQTVSSAATPIFGSTEVKNVTATKTTQSFNITTTKPSANVMPTAFNVTPTTKVVGIPADSTVPSSIPAKVTSTSGLVFGTVSSSTTLPVKPSSTPNLAVGTATPSPKPSSTQSSIFGTATTSSSTSKPTSIFGSAAPNIVTKPTSTSIFGSATTAASTASASFSFGGSTTASIFGTTNQKPVEAPVATTAPKSFMFSSKTTTASTTAATQSLLVAALSSTVSSSQAADSTKVSSTQQPTILSIPSLINTPKTQVAATPPSQTTAVPLTGTTTQSSIFASSATSASQSIKSSVFTPTTISQTSTPAVATVTSTIPMTTAGPITAATTLSSVFGSQATTSQPIFGSAINTPSTQPTTLASTTTTGLIFGTTVSTSKPSIFGSLDAAVSKPSAFGSSPGTTATTSVFAASTTTTQSSIFGGVPSTSTPSVFGAATPSTSPIFGSTPTQTSVFGGAVTTTQQSIFGTPPPATTTQSQGFGLFGDAPQKSSIFGNPPTSSTQSSIFGSTNQTVFGNPASSSGSVFGQSQQSSAFGQPSIFAPAATGSTFGTSSTAFGNSTSTFGQSTGSIFGNAPTTSSGSSIFGGTPTTGSTFGSTGSVFGTPASSVSSPFGSSSVFSPSTTQPSTASFGFGGLSVGSTATTSSSGFGATPTPNPFGGGDSKSIFGTPPASAPTSAFGSNTGSLFGTPPQSFGGGFGNQSPFAQQSTFGQSSFGNSSFGQQPSGPFSSGSSPGVGQTGFGATANFQKPAGFGASPVFGGTASFGSGPSFGGAPAFGSAPSFGGTSKVFGAASPGFGATTNTQSAGFGNLAHQPTVGFGNLAQQAANAPSSNAPFSGNSSFSSWR